MSALTALRAETDALARAAQEMDERAKALVEKFRKQDEERGGQKSEPILFTARYSRIESGDYWSSK